MRSPLACDIGDRLIWLKALRSARGNPRPMNIPIFPSPALLEVARRMVPRYTSYPTAPHFTPAVTGEVQESWLREAGAAHEPVSLYIHVPFCREICAYCGCTTRAARRDGPIIDYAATLRAEIALVAARLGPVEVSHIHWGGGTPATVPPAIFRAIVDDLDRAFRFRADMEHAIEIDPRHLTLEHARVLADAGVNRASLGVQTFDPDVQAAIGRVQPAAVVARTFEMLRAAGIQAVNADLIYGLPGQTRASITETIATLIEMEPSRVAIFGYAHVPWMKANQKLIDETKLPGAEERLLQAALARELLAAGRYVEIGIDHFALLDDPLAAASRIGSLHRNFQGYTDDAATTLVGLGASSISRMPAGYAQNAPDVAGWRRAIEAGRLPIVRGKPFEGEDLMRADVIEAILCDFEVDLAEIAAGHGREVDVFSADIDKLRPLVEAGWVEVHSDTVRISRYRQEIARVVAAAFDAYLGHGGRHSSAV